MFYVHFTDAKHKLGNVRHKEENVARFETEQRRCNRVKKSIRTVSLLPRLLSENYNWYWWWKNPAPVHTENIICLFRRVSCAASCNLDPWLWMSPTGWRNGRVTMVHGTLASWAYMVCLCLNPELDPPDLKPFGDRGYYLTIPLLNPSKFNLSFYRKNTNLFIFLGAFRVWSCFYMFLYVGPIHGQRATRQIHLLAKVWREPGEVSSR